MFLLMSDFRKDLLLLIIITVILGTVLVSIGGYVTDRYFSHMVSDLIGDYGEYDFLFTLAEDKEDLALTEINKVIETSLPGIKIKRGPRVAGSTNYLLKLPAEYKNGNIYGNIGRYFSDIPGLLGINVITEPRLPIRGFRGSSLAEIRPDIENIEGIDFTYKSGDGLDIVLRDPRLIPGVKEEINDILDNYQLFEIRYSLNQHPENREQLQTEIMELISKEFNIKEVKNVTGSSADSRSSLLKSLKEMKTFLLSYASKIVVEGVEDSDRILPGTELVVPREGGTDLVLEVIESEEGTVTSLVQEGDLGDLEGDGPPEVYLPAEERYLGQGKVNNPRQNLVDALATLNEISPKLTGFLQQSEQQLDYSQRINEDLEEINEGLNTFSRTSETLDKTLRVWQQENLSLFLGDLRDILGEIENNIGDINNLQEEMIKTSNNLKEGARLIEERIIYIPRSNSLYDQLNDLKEVFLTLSTMLDENYDLATGRMEELAPLLESIESSRGKIDSLMEMEQTLNEGVNLEEIESGLSRIKENLQMFDIGQLQEELGSVQQLLEEVKNTQLPVILEQLEYIQSSLPDLEEAEIIETINLIDSYIAGEVIPGDQIQLLVRGSYNEQELIRELKPLVDNPAVTYLNMEAGSLQNNPRGEVLNILRQVRAVIATIIALIFTLLVMIMDQSLLVSVIQLNNGNGYLYSFASGSLIFSLIYYFSRINFPYLNPVINLLLGGVIGLIVALFSGMLNPVSREEWEAGKALGFSCAEIMREIIIPAGKPGLLYVFNRPQVIFK